MNSINTNMTRFEYLDGIRTLAALFVLVRHTSEYFNFTIFRSYMAVDLFFILSGFVIASAYEKKLLTKSLSTGQFIVIRAIRLYPIFLLSLGLAFTVWVMFGLALEPRPLSWLEISSAFILTLFFLPSLPASGLPLFAINPPYWSLFFEVFANLVYAKTCHLLTNKVLIGMVSVLGVVLALIGVKHRYLDLGFNWAYMEVTAGFARSFFGIFFGILLFRLRHLVRDNTSPYLPILAILFALASPQLRNYNYVADMLCLVVIFPLSILLLSKASTSPLSRAFSFLGAASYPLYVLHVPVSILILSLFQSTIVEYAPYSGFLFMVALVIFCIFLEKKVDEPFRRYLTQKLKMRRARTAHTT